MSLKRPQVYYTLIFEKTENNKKVIGITQIEARTPTKAITRSIEFLRKINKKQTSFVNLLKWGGLSLWSSRRKAPIFIKQD